MCVKVRFGDRGAPTDVLSGFLFCSFIDDSLAFSRTLSFPFGIQFFLHSLPYGFSRVHLPGRNRFDFLLFGNLFFSSFVFAS